MMLSDVEEDLILSNGIWTWEKRECFSSTPRKWGGGNGEKGAFALGLAQLRAGSQTLCLLQIFLQHELEQHGCFLAGLHISCNL